MKIIDLKRSLTELKLEIWKKPELILEVENPTEELVLVALRKDVQLFKRLSFKAPLIVHYAIQQHPSFILNVENPTEELWLMAIKKQPDLLCHCFNPSAFLIEEAINQNGLLIKHVENQTPFLKELACAQNPQSLEYIKHPDETLCLKYLKKDGNLLRWIKNPSDAMIRTAVIQNFRAMIYVESPSKKLLSWYLRDQEGRLSEVSSTVVIDDELLVEAGLRGYQGMLNQRGLSLEMKYWLWQQYYVEAKWESFKDFELGGQIKLNVKEPITPLGQMFLEAMEKEYVTFKMFPQHIDRREVLTPLVLAAYLKENPNLLAGIPFRHRSYRLCRYAIQQSKDLVIWSPYHVLDLIHELSENETEILDIFVGD